MKVYIAAPWVDRDIMPPIAEMFVEAGFTITHPWWVDDPFVPDYPSNMENPLLEDIARKDFLGVVEADAVVLLNTGKSEGKAVETGIALAMCHRVILVGMRSNIFHYMPEIEIVSSVSEAIEALL